MILIKILAAFLTLSQVTTRPDAVKTKFDPATDQAEVTQILRNGCEHMRKAFDVESLDLDDLIKTAMDDPAAVSAEIKPLQGLKFDSLIIVYRQFCKNENVPNSPVNIGEVIRFYNAAVADLPDHTRLKGTRFIGAGGVLDAKGERFADLSDSSRRAWVPLKDIPVTSRRRSSRPRTSDSTSTRASTSAGLFAPWCRIWRAPAARRAVRPSPSRW